MIKAVLFDFDGVLTIDATGSATITNYLSKTCGMPLEKVKSCYYKYNKQLLLGELTHRDMWQAFCEDLGQEIAYDVLMDSFLNTELDETMISLVKQLKERYLIGMVTDNKADRIDTILDYRELRKYFDVVAVSANVHSGKERPEIFEYVLDTLKVSAGECVFIDNTEKNLTVPKQMGMETIFYDDANRDYDAFVAKLFSCLQEQKV